MSKKNTPGPWHTVLSPQSNSAYISGKQKYFIACLAKHDLPWEEVEANVKLMASAPDLLDALILCRSVIESSGLYDLSERMAYDKATLAIEKAIKP